MEREYKIVGSGYRDTSEVPKDDDLHYLCTTCGAAIRSVPQESGGCACGNVFIDKEYWRLVVEDFDKLLVVRLK